MIKSIYKKNRYKFLLSLIPVVIVGIMAPLRSYIMQLLIDSSNYGELLEKCLIAAVLRNKAMTFLDEITSGLDNATAYEIEKRLLDEDMTIINITHRYNKALMQKYNEIIVMDAGKIVERGRFDELMEKEGEFFDLFKILSE